MVIIGAVTFIFAPPAGVNIMEAGVVQVLSSEAGNFIDKHGKKYHGRCFKSINNIAICICISCFSSLVRLKFNF